MTGFDWFRILCWCCCWPSMNSVSHMLFVSYDKAEKKSAVRRIFSFLDRHTRTMHSEWVEFGMKSRTCHVSSSKFGVCLDWNTDVVEIHIEEKKNKQNLLKMLGVFITHHLIRNRHTAHIFFPSYYHTKKKKHTNVRKKERQGEEEKKKKYDFEICTNYISVWWQAAAANGRFGNWWNLRWQYVSLNKNWYVKLWTEIYTRRLSPPLPFVSKVMRECASSRLFHLCFVLFFFSCCRPVDWICFLTQAHTHHTPAFTRERFPFASMEKIYI